MKKRPPQRQIKRVGIYNRVSTEEQVNGYSLDVQLADATAYTKRRWPQAEIQVYTERGESGTSTTHRDAFHSLIADARAGRIDAIVVHKLDRFARSREDSVVFKSLLARDGVYVYSVSENIDPHSPESILVEAMLEGVAEYYSVNLSHEVKKGLRGRALNGLPHTNIIPFGYCHGQCLSCIPINPCPNVGQANNPGIWHLHPTESQAILGAFKRYLRPDVNYDDIALWLNSQGLKTHYRKGIQGFSDAGVAHLFHNRLYTGMLKLDGEWLPSKHPAIVSTELWEQVQKKRIASIGVPPSRGRHVYIARGLLECARCHRRFHGVNGAADYHKRYYACMGRRYFDCDQPMLREDRVAQIMDSIVAGWRLPADWKAEIMRRLGRGQEIENIQRQRAALESRLTRAKRLYLCGDMSDEEYHRESRAIRQQLGGLQPIELADVERAGEYLDNFYRLWEKASIDEKNAMLRQAIQKIVLDKYQIQQIVPRLGFEVFFQGS